MKKKVKKLGRDSKGNPESLQARDNSGFDLDPKKLAQRRGDGLKGAMGKEQAKKR